MRSRSRPQEENKNPLLIVLVDTVDTDTDANTNHDENGLSGVVNASPHQPDSTALTTILLPDLSNPDTTCFKTYWKTTTILPTTTTPTKTTTTTTTTTTTAIYELYGIENETTDKYSSFLVNGMVVPNGTLHTLTRVDPLWFVLRLMSPNDDDDNDDDDDDNNNQNSSSWKPLDQWLCDICQDDTTTRELLLGVEASQYMPILVSLELSEEDLVYKFSKKHALSWLFRKQQAVEAVLRHQNVEEQMRNNRRCSKVGGGGGFAQGFVPGRHDNPQQPVPEQVGLEGMDFAASTDNTVRDESIQVVCQYLSNAWRECFLNHLAVSRQDVLEMKTTKPTTLVKKIKPTLDWNAGLTATASLLTSSASSATQKESTKSAMTAGAKQLQKVNTKGMSKLSTFFAPKPKTK